MSPNILCIARLPILLILIGTCFVTTSHAQTTAAPAKEPDSGSINKTLVYIAGSSQEHAKLVELLEMGANPNASIEGITALKNAVDGPVPKNVRALLEYGADPNIGGVKVFAAKGYESWRGVDAVVANAYKEILDMLNNLPPRKQPKRKQSEDEEVASTSDWVEDGPAGVGKTIYIRNNSQKKSIRLTELNVYECVNVGVGGCGVSTNVATILPGQTVAVRLIPPQSLNNASGISFLYKYWTESVK